MNLVIGGPVLMAPELLARDRGRATLGHGPLSVTAEFSLSKMATINQIKNKVALAN